MTIGSVHNSSLAGIQQGLQNLNKAAQDIASAGVSGGQSIDAVAEATLQAKQAELQVKASVSTPKAADELLGSLIDLHA